MKYIDLHCDALTKEGVASVTAETLKKGGCEVQAFAAFVDGGKGEGFERAVELCDRFDALCAREHLHAVRRAEDLMDGVNALLTVEGGEGIGTNLRNLEYLYARGVRMLGLTWNYPNALGGCAFPHSRCPLEGELTAGRATEGVSRAQSHSFEGASCGLTPFGRVCVERMCELKLLPDLSHGSDALVRDVARICSRRGVPCLASHSNARTIFPHPRNLTDEGIRLIAESGGVVGLNFFANFLSAEKSREAQRRALLLHLRHMLKVGGEDLPALGTDFDGALANPYIASPADMPHFLSDLEETFGGRIAEKIARFNALRLLRSL